MYFFGKESIDIDDGEFNEVLYVPSLSINIISIYHITNGRVENIIEFTPYYFHNPRFA
jgi:hypothetical protein